MSLKNVKAFYQKLASDAGFRSQIENVNNQEMKLELVKNYGYNFTQKEFEEYTEKLLETGKYDDGLQDLNEKELETVFGGASSLYISPLNYMQVYGSPVPREPESIQWC